MNDQEMREKLNELMKNEAFERKLGEAKSGDEVRDVCTEYGLELSDDQIADIASEIAQPESALEDAELSDDELEEVAGGRRPYYWFGQNGACQWYTTSTGTRISDMKACYKFTIHKKKCPYCRTSQMGCARQLPVGKLYR